MRRKQLLFSKREKAEKSTTMGDYNENSEGVLGVPNSNTKRSKNSNEKEPQEQNKSKNNEDKTQIEKVSTETFNNDKLEKTKKNLDKELETLKNQLIEERNTSITKVNELNEIDTQKNVELKILTSKFNNMIQQLKFYEQSLVVRTRNISKHSTNKSEEEIKKQIKVTEAQIKNYQERANKIENDYNLFKKKAEVEKNKENDLNTELSDLRTEIKEKTDEINELKITSNIHLNCSKENSKLWDKFTEMNTAYKYELKKAKQLALSEIDKKEEDDQIIKEEYNQKDDRAKAEEDEKNILPKIKVLRFKDENSQKLEMKIIKLNKIGLNKSNEVGNGLKYYKKLNTEYNNDRYVKKRDNNIKRNKISEIKIEENYLFDENEEKIMEKVLPENMFNSYKEKFNDILQQKKEMQEQLKTETDIKKKENDAIVNKCEYNRMELKNKKIDNLKLVMKFQKLRDKINSLKQNIKEFNEKINKEQKKLNEENRINKYYKKLQGNQEMDEE